MAQWAIIMACIVRWDQRGSSYLLFSIGNEVQQHWQILPKKKTIGKEDANQAKRIRIFSLIFSFEKEDNIFYITSSLRKGQDILCNLSLSLALVRWSTLSAFVFLGECSISTLTSKPKIPIRRARGTVFLNFQLPNGPGPFLVFMFFFYRSGPVHRVDIIAASLVCLHVFT